MDALYFFRDQRFVVGQRLSILAELCVSITRGEIIIVLFVIVCLLGSV